MAFPGRYSFDTNDGDTVAVKIVATGPVVPTYVSYSLEFAPPVPCAAA